VARLATVNEPIRYENGEFAISQAIGNCPDHTVIWELVRNAVENARLAVPEPGRIEFFVELWPNGKRKLGLYNEGPGMSRSSLSRLMNMAATGKELGEDKNFGQGAKVSGMAASPAGLIYRSCTGQGEAWELQLLMEQPEGLPYPVCTRYVYEEGGVRGTTFDVSEQMEAKGRNLFSQWTEVVLVGKSEDADTVECLLEGRGRKRWLIELINQRFYRFSEGIRIRHANATTGEATDRSPTGMATHYKGDLVERFEDVLVQHERYGPVQIRFIKLAGNGEEGRSKRRSPFDAYGLKAGDHSCIVFRDEVFEFASPWRRHASAFGFIFASADFCVEIHLPEDAPVRMDFYRVNLLHKNGKDQVRIEEFAELAKASRPEWVLDILASYENNASSVDFKDRIRRLMNQLQVDGVETRVIDPSSGTAEGSAPGRSRRGGQGPVGPDPAPINTDDQTSQRTRRTRGTPREQVTIDVATARFRPPWDTNWFEDFRGKAGEYSKEDNAVYLNDACSTYRRWQEAIRAEWPDPEEQEAALHIWEEEYKWAAVSCVVYAYVYRKEDGWQPSQWCDALTPETLTLHLTDPKHYTAAKHKIGQRLASRISEKARCASGR
jgi:hypothetical protein